MTGIKEKEEKMPVYLNAITDFSELEDCESVLIIPCRFCPAASMAVKNNTPYFEFLKNFLTTESYEQYLREIQSGLTDKGVKCDLFHSYMPHQFVVCMWSTKRRKKLLKHAEKYEALLVIGCEAAVDTVYSSVKSTSCRIYHGMRTEGIMSIKPIFELPCNISLELNNVTPLIHQAPDSNPWISL
jgi:hypothetical protein